MSEPSRRSMHQVIFEEENNTTGLEFTIAPVHPSDWKANIDANACASFAVQPSIEQNSSPSYNAAF